VNVTDFDYDLPDELIAQEPLACRDASRLLVLDRAGGAIDHRRFRDLLALLRPGDRLVLNDTRVIPARLLGRKESGGRVELFLAERLGGDGSTADWRCLVRASRAPRPGSAIEFVGGLRATVLEPDSEGCRVRLGATDGTLEQVLEEVGRVPLPPYIHREDRGSDAADRQRYQTVFARHPGAVAAPTAGLHFTSDLLSHLADAGVEHSFVTLHVGLGTFLPVRVEQVEEHRIHSERFRIGEATAAAIDETRRSGGRVVAVGTTVVRTLESSAEADGRVGAGEGRCDLYIYPGFRFRAVDALITNFHLPRSTLLMLVAAFAGREPVLAAYREAVRREYRFYSYGDAMFIGAA